MADLEHRLRDIGALPAAPGVAMEILRLNESDSTEIGDLVEVISKDPAICSKLLKAANSSALGRQGTVSNLYDAVMFLGIRRVNMLALSFSLMSTSMRHSNGEFNYTRFWMASVVTTVASRRIAGMFAPNLIDEAFVGGLLCDFGQLVLAECASDLYDPVLRQLARDERRVHEIENELLGVDHAGLAKDLFNSWGLPTVICRAVGAHHDPGSLEESDPEAAVLARIIHTASCCGDLYADGGDSDLNEIIALGNRYFGMNMETCKALFESLQTDVEEFLAILDPNNMDVAESERLRAKAGERLMEENLDLEQRFQSLSCDLARVWSRVAELENIANFDPLTGLHSRSHLELLISEYLHGSTASDEPIGLLMMDIDYFKEINDRFGHPAGDKVLVAVSEVLTKALPRSCIIARWGGDEFVAFCPGTDIGELREIAENLLREMRLRDGDGDSQKVNLTISLGGVSISDPMEPLEVEQMIREADVELYHAKRAGRNQASVTEIKKAEG